MAKKQGGKDAATDKKSRKAAKADAKALKAVGKAAKSSVLSGKDLKSQALVAPEPVETAGKARGRKALAATMPDASPPKAGTGSGRDKSLRSVRASALGLLPSAPAPVSAQPDPDPKAVARELGSRIVALMSEPSGRIFAAELLTAVATALTQSSTEEDVAGPGLDPAGAVVRRRGRRPAADASSAPPT